MIHYRKATVEDIPVLIKLRTDFLNEVMNTGHPGDIIADGLKQYFSKHLQQCDYINWLALHDEEIIPIKHQKLA